MTIIKFLQRYIQACCRNFRRWWQVGLLKAGVNRKVLSWFKIRER